MGNMLGDSWRRTGYQYHPFETNSYLAVGTKVTNEYDGWLFVLDSNGTAQANNVFGGVATLAPSGVPITDLSILLKVDQAYKVVGGSTASGFTAGANLGHILGKGYNAFVSQLNYWPLSVINITNAKKQLQVFPNPSTGWVTIAFAGNDEKGQLRITDVQGHAVYKQRIKAQQQSIAVNTGEWEKGSYIVMWQGEDGGVLTTKLIKN